MKRDFFSDMEEALLTSLKSLESMRGYAAVLNFMTAQSVSKVRPAVNIETACNEDKLENLAQLAFVMVKTCQNATDAQKVIRICLKDEFCENPDLRDDMSRKSGSEMATRDAYPQLNSSPLTFMDNQMQFPKLWPQHVIDFYFRVSVKIRVLESDA